MRNILQRESIRRALLGPVVLTCIWFVMTLLVQPIGDFPLNDDWCYGRVVQLLVEQGSLQFPNWGAPTLIAQALWGTIFCMPFGFSFTALRMSTLVLGLVGVLSTYYMLREIKVGQVFAITGTLLIAVNPLYYILSNTFMTDVPFYAFAMLSFLLFLRGIKGENNGQVVGATILACVATLTRQIGIIIPVCFAIAFVVKDGLNAKTLLKALLPPVVVLVVYIGYTECLKLTVGLSSTYYDKIDVLLNRLAHPSFESFGSFVNMGIYTALYLGLFLLPLLVVTTPAKWSALGRRNKVEVIPKPSEGG